MMTSKRLPCLCSLAVLLAGTSAAQTPSQRINVEVDPDAPHMAFEVELAAAGSSVHALWSEWRMGVGVEVSAQLYYNRSLDGGASWMPGDVRIDVGFVSEPSFSAANQRIAAQGTSVASVWEEREWGPYQTGFGVFANRSDDGGATWLAFDPSVSEDLGQNVFDPRMAMVGSSVYVAWADDREGPSAIYFDRSLDGGLTWMPDDVRVAQSSGYRVREPFPFRLDLAASGTAVYVVWEDDRNTYPEDVHDLYFNRSLDGGLTWLPEDVRIDVGGSVPGDSRNPRIEVQDSAVYVVWDDDLFGRRDVFFNRSLDGGATWLPRELRLDRGSPLGAADSTEPRIAARGSAVFVVWSDRRDGSGDVYLNRSLDGGTTWMTPDVRLDTGDDPGSVNSTRLRIAAEGPGVLVAWSDRKTSTPSEPGYGRIGFNRSLDDGNTWLPAHVFVNDGDDASNPALATGASSAYVAWIDTRHPQGWPDVYATLPLGHQPYGAGTPGTGGLVPSLRADGLPCVGTPFALEVGNGLGGAQLLVLFGLGGKAALPLAGGTLLVRGPYLRLAATLGGTPGLAGDGTASIPVPVPNDLSLIGLRLNSQGGVLDPGAQKRIALTGALETWVL